MKTLYETSKLEVQRKKLINYLKLHRTINEKEAQTLLDINELSLRVDELRSLGFKIDKVWIMVKSENDVYYSFAKYILVKYTSLL